MSIHSVQYIFFIVGTVLRLCFVDDMNSRGIYGVPAPVLVSAESFPFKLVNCSPN